MLGMCFGLAVFQKHQSTTSELREWKYTIEGYAPDGTWLCIVFSLKYANVACLITVFSVVAKGRTV
jgi:hypothetical protein